MIIAELHRRRVLHMMAYYIVSAWVVLQVADLAFESWGVPDEVMRYVWITAVMGFPIALLFSWKYDITIHGIVRTPPIVASQGADLSLRRSDHLVLIALVVVVSTLAYGLTREIVTAIAEPLRIAVLPLKNLSRSEDDSYIALGTTEELTSRLSKLGNLRVIANRSVLRFAESNLSAAQIGQELGVDVLLEGSVRKLGERVRIGLRLIDTDSEDQQWTREFDGFLDNLLAVQINVADQVASALNVQMESDERRRLVKRSTDNAEAYRLYLKGRYFWSKLIRDEVEKAARLFQQAINLDPTYGQAWTGLADTYNFLGELGALPPDEAFSKARSAAEHALEIDDELAEAHTSLGQILTNYYWDWQAAGSHFEQAIVLDPNYLPARHFYSEYLRDLGRIDEALAQVHTAQQLDPLSSPSKLYEGMILMLGRRCEAAIARLQELIDTDPHFKIAHLYLALCQLDTGDYQQALNALDVVDPDHRFPDAVGARGMVYAASGHPDQARATLDALDDLGSQTYVSPVIPAIIHIQLGEHDRAFELLEQGYRERTWMMRLLKVASAFDPIRSDPRYAALLDRVGLPP